MSVVRTCLLAGLVVAALLSIAQGEGDMNWTEASDPRALCNDFTRAGYFLRRNESSDKWVIFLESGSLCFSNDTCNRRFFNAEVREQDANHAYPSNICVVPRWLS